MSSTTVVPNNLVPVITTERLPAKRPDNLTDDQIKKLHEQADKAVAALAAAKGSDLIIVSDQIVNVGVKDQKQVAGNIALMQERMGNVLYSTEKSNVADNLSKDIVDLQNALSLINKDDISKESRYRLISWIPLFGNKLVTALKTTSTKGMTLQQFVEHLDDSIKTGEMMLRQDNAQITVMTSDLDEQRKLVMVDAYFAEILMEKLTALISDSRDIQTRNAINDVLFRVSTRAQDLRAMDNIHEQFAVSLRMTRQNNELLIDGARRMSTMGMNVVYVSMAIHSALMRAEKVKNVEVATGEFIGKMLISNATILNGMVKEIGDIYKRPFVPMEMLQKASEELAKAIDETNKLKSEGIDKARENIAKLKDMTSELKNKVGSMPNTEINSLEASKTLQLAEKN